MISWVSFLQVSTTLIVKQIKVNLRNEAANEALHLVPLSPK